jgi:hypothetical protein
MPGTHSLGRRGGHLSPQPTVVSKCFSLRLATSSSARFGAASLSICAKDSLRYLKLTICVSSSTICATSMSRRILRRTHPTEPRRSRLARRANPVMRSASASAPRSRSAGQDHWWSREAHAARDRTLEIQVHCDDGRLRPEPITQLARLARMTSRGSSKMEPIETKLANLK